MKPVDLLLHLEAYIALESALGFSLRARESLLRDFRGIRRSQRHQGIDQCPNRS